MTLILGIDTATSVSAGLVDDTATLASVRIAGNRHVEELTPLVERVLAEAGKTYRDLTGVAVGLGPGPFTGLRVGIAAAHVLASTLGIPVKGLCSLDALAAAAGLGGEVVAASDARRKELYWARYVDGVRVEGPAVSAPTEVPALPVVGPGAALYADVLGERARLDHAETVDAAVLARLSLTADDLGLEPLYLRKPDATEPAARKPILVGKHEAANR